MKRFLTALMLLALTIAVFGATGTINLSTQTSGAQLQRSNDYGLNIRYSVDNIDYFQVSTTEGFFTEIGIKGFTSTNVVGMPKLPLLRKIIQVPVNATVVPRIVANNTLTINLSDNGISNKLIPAQESVSKSASPNTMQFRINNDFYNGNNWTEYQAIKVEEIGYMRGVRMVALDFSPAQYNPQTRQLKVITDMDVDVEFIGGDLQATEALRAKTYSPVFEGIYSSQVFNYEPMRATLNRYPLGYIIITPQTFVSTLQPFIEWKRREGFNVTVATTDQTGTTTTAIKTYLQNIWNAATVDNPAPSYLLLVGDTPQIPAFTGTTSTGHVTDLPYVRLQGTDFVPELYYGRFSATSIAELQPQIDKSLMYEQYTWPNDSFMQEVEMIAGVDATYGSTHANGQINYGTQNYYNAAHGIISHTYLYPASGNSDAQIVSDISNGVGYANYTAHGSETTWYDPSFTIANINSLQNVNKYPVMVGNCCLTNHFDTALCFGEALLRAQNKGAALYIGGTNSTYWDEDYWWGVGNKPIAGGGTPWQPNKIGVYDALFHEHDEVFNDWAATAGAMIVMGNLAVTQANSSRINYYWEIYSIMGDPSLIPFMGIPATINAQLPSTLFLGVNTTQITAEPYTRVAISMNNVLHGTGLVDASGSITLSFTPFDAPGMAQIVMTRPNRRPTIANISVIPNSGPYVAVNSISYDDPFNDIPEAGDNALVNVVLGNVGSQAATGVTVTMTTSNPYVTINTGTANVNTIESNGTYSIDSIFEITISAAIPDQSTITFDFTITDGLSNTWQSHKSITVNAPNIVFGTATYTDPNNNSSFEPGETITVSIPITNNGHMVTEGGGLWVVSGSPNATVSQELFTIPVLGINANYPVTFQVTIGQNATDGSVIPVGLSLTMWQQYISTTILMPVGLIQEGFESNNFTAFPWVNNSTVPWTIATTPNVHTGNYAAKSGAISHGGSTSLTLTLTIGSAGNITFWRKVSSESGYDFLKFLMDNNELGSWSGTLEWEQQSYPVTAGQHTFKWTYSKDNSVTSGSDCGWIDDIRFPITGNSAVALYFSPNNDIVLNDVPFNSTVSADFSVRNLGNVAMTGSITIPNGFVLYSNGNILTTNTYNYNIAANSLLNLQLVYTVTNQPIHIDDYVVITSNDTVHPINQIHVVLNTITGNINPDGIPVVTQLKGNYPNPFNPTTTIKFGLKEAGAVHLSIYNVKGQLIRTLVNGSLNAGNHNVIWNGKDNTGKNVSSGVYLYRLETAGYAKTLKMMMMK